MRGSGRPRQARPPWLFETRSNRDDLDRAFLEIRLLGNRIGCIQRHLVDELAGVEPWNEDHTTRWPVASLDVDAGADFAAPRDHPYFGSLIDAARARVFGMHETPRTWKRLVELGYAHGHRSGVPMLEHAAGHEPDVEFLVGGFRRRLIGYGDDPGLAVGLSVEIDALARFDEGIVTLPIAPARLLAVNNRPAQTSVLMIRVVGAEVVTMPPAER